jgi:hypothetical protein
MNIVLIETSGNQRYIFATNKMRENVGASELTYRVGTETVLKAVEKITDKKIYEENDLAGKKLRANLLNKNTNPEFGNGSSIEVIIATSGKAILLVDKRSTAESIIREVTQTALRDMPGLTIHGAISEEVDTNLSNVHKRIGEVHRKLEGIRYRIPGNEERFPRLPFAAPCSTSGLPAQREGYYEPQKKVYSQISCTKSDNKREGHERIKEILNFSNLIDPEKIESCPWTAVIHADGNGLGQIFLDFNNYAGFDQNGNWSGRRYLNQYREFSIALDICTITATKIAIEHIWEFIAKQKAEEQQKRVSELSSDELKKIPLPVVPLVLGGDDLTVLCDGEYALKFTHDFLREFENQTEQNEVIREIVNNAFGNRDKEKPTIKHLGICAGIAIIKPHFPFHQAYELAEQLLKSAKQVKEKIKHMRGGQKANLPSSALDFHILYDSAYSELDMIREKLRIERGTTWLYARPYVVTSEEKLKNANDSIWLDNHRFSQLENRVNRMRAKDKDDPNKRALPNSQLHNLREALFLGSQEAGARMNLIIQRYSNKGLKDLLVNESFLFFDEKDDEKKERATHFIDALEVVEFWKGFEELSQSEEEKDDNE